MMSLIAAAYARYSTNNQQETSIAAQLEGIQRYCDREGIALSGMPYIDEARSGTNMDRPGFQRLLSDARAGKFEAVVVYDISRGSRDVADWFLFRKQMSELGIRVFSATNTLGDIDDPNAFLTELISVGLGQHMVLQSRQKSIAGQRIRAERGLHCGGVAPLGYDIVDGRYVINEREAAVVRMIFERYAAGASYSQIVAAIDKTGVRGKSGRRIENNTLHYILKNERYTGKYIWFDRVERHMHKHVGRDNDNKVIHMDIIPALVSQEVWTMVKNRMESNRRLGSGQRKEGRVYLLSGLIRCGECGSACSGVTTVSKGIEYPRYICLGKRHEKKCTVKNVKADTLEKFIIDTIRDRFLCDDQLYAVAQLFIDQLSQEDTETADAIRKELRTVTDKLRNVTDLIIDTGLSPDLVDRRRELDSRRRELEERLAACDDQFTFDIDTLVSIMREDAERLTSSPREIILRYVHSILVFDDHIDITWAPNYINKKRNTRIITGVKEAGSPGASPVLLTLSVPRASIPA